MFVYTIVFSLNSCIIKRVIMKQHVQIAQYLYLQKVNYIFLFGVGVDVGTFFALVQLNIQNAKVHSKVGLPLYDSRRGQTNRVLPLAAYCLFVLPRKRVRTCTREYPRQGIRCCLVQVWIHLLVRAICMCILFFINECLFNGLQTICGTSYIASWRLGGRYSQLFDTSLKTNLPGEFPKIGNWGHLLGESVTLLLHKYFDFSI